MSLVARALEQAGIPTVIFGSGKDILEYCGAPRFVFTDFPLGNPCGKPDDPVSQAQVFSTALELLCKATRGGASLASGEKWEGDFDWKKNFMYVGPENAEALRAKGDARRAEQEQMRKRILGNRNKNH